MRVALLAMMFGLVGCSEARQIREWRPDDHDQPEDEGQVEGSVPAGAQQAQDPEPARAPRPAQVEAADGGALSVDVLWRQQCQRCHARDGSGRTSMAQRMPVADLRESALDEAQIVRIVTNGRREMPGFGEDLDEAAIRALAGKVLSFRGNAE